ncbi:MAG: hemerythrin domain-containing protein [Flavobacteriales bacterium]
MLCWKIRSGFRKGVCKERIKAYTLWFYKEHLLHHFEIEEKQVFSLIGSQHELVKKALSERKKLHKLFQFKEEAEICLSLIEEKLEAHIRFEERVLLNEIQEQINEDSLQKLDLQNAIPPFCDNESDVFWS